MKKYQKPTMKTASLEYEAVICTSGEHGMLGDGYADTQYGKARSIFDTSD